MSPRIPHLLEPFMHVPQTKQTLYLISHVLGASANWLILRYLCAAFGDDLSQRRAQNELDSAGVLADGIQDAGSTAVVLVSWMREYDFWRTEARKAAGLNLDQLREKGRFAYIDGLSSLFAPGAAAQTIAKQTTIPPRASTNPPRPGTPPPSSQDSIKPPTTASKPASTHPTLTDPTLGHLETTVVNAVSELRRSRPNTRVLLILDTPTILLQTFPLITSTALHRTLLTLRSAVYSTILNVPADTPFIQPATATADKIYDNIEETGNRTPLETENAAFVMGAVNQATRVLSCRRLGTGWADDVSGVVRVTRGGAAEAGESGKGEEGEWLYYVGSDGGVKVWGRGEGQ